MKPAFATGAAISCELLVRRDQALVLEPGMRHVLVNQPPQQAAGVEEDLAAGRLIELPAEVPRCEMALLILRLKGPKGEAWERAWTATTDPDMTSLRPSP